MQLGQIKENLLKRSTALRELGATGLYIFGSRAKGQARSNSDLDLIIDYDSNGKIPSLFKLVEFECAVIEEFGIPVHITTRRSIHPMMKSEIEKTAIRVF